MTATHMEEAIRNSIAQVVDDRPMPGYVIGIEDRDGPLARMGFAGDGSTPAQDAVFAFASMTKPVTAAAAMQLVERGILALDEPVSAHLDHFERLQVLTGFDADGHPLLRPPSRPVTLRHLLSHTAGFGYDLWSADVARYAEAEDVPSLLSGQIAALNTPLLFDPGSAWEYGIGIDWAGRLIEAVSGSTLETHMAEHLFGPLGMTSSTFRPDAAARDRIPGMVMRIPGDALHPLPLPAPTAPEFDSGGQGLVGSLDDYMTFLRMLLNRGTLDGTFVLTPGSVAEMLNDQLAGVPVRRLPTQNAMITGDLDLLAGAPAGQGLGWMLNLTAGRNGRSAGSASWAGAFNTSFWLDPVLGIAGAMLTQLLPFGDERCSNVAEAFERGAYAALVRE